MNTICCFYDCSGSVGESIRTEYINFTKTLAKLKMPLRHFHFDHSSVEPIFLSAVERVGGGGACFEPLKSFVQNEQTPHYGIIFTDQINEEISWLPPNYTILEFFSSLPTLSNVCKTLGLPHSELRSVFDDWKPAW